MWLPITLPSTGRSKLTCFEILADLANNLRWQTRITWILQRPLLIYGLPRAEEICPLRDTSRRQVLKMNQLKLDPLCPTRDNNIPVTCGDRCHTALVTSHSWRPPISHTWYRISSARSNCMHATHLKGKHAKALLCDSRQMGPANQVCTFLHFVVC